jgi:outer membrane protein OmpA-like peptidoglycan-associated protein
VSNPGDRWRKSWMIGALGAALLTAVTLGRCASSDSASSTATFTAASVQADDARFAAELPPGIEVLVLRGFVTDKTAKALRTRAATLAAETPGLQIDDRLTVAADGIEIVEPEGLLVALAKGLVRPVALRVNGDLGAELTGVARTDEERTVVAKIVSASLREDAELKNSVTLLPSGDQADTGEAALPSASTESVPATDVQDSTSTETTALVTAGQTQPDPTQAVAAEVATTEPLPADPASTATTTATTLAAAATTTIVPPTLESNGTIALEGVQFDLGSARLTAASATVLDRLVKTLNDNPDLNIAIAGHTDNSGDPGFNTTLSKARANSVLQYLVKAGIDATRLSAQGYGDTQPRADNATSSGRKQNRRIEVTAQ